MIYEYKTNVGLHPSKCSPIIHEYKQKTITVPPEWNRDKMYLYLLADYISFNKLWIISTRDSSAISHKIWFVILHKETWRVHYNDIVMGMVAS